MMRQLMEREQKEYKAFPGLMEKQMPVETTENKKKNSKEPAGKKPEPVAGKKTASKKKTEVY